MKEIADIRIKVYELPEQGFKALVYGDGSPDKGDDIYGTTRNQVRAGIKRRLDKMIVEPNKEIETGRGNLRAG